MLAHLAPVHDGEIERSCGHDASAFRDTVGPGEKREEVMPLFEPSLALSREALLARRRAASGLARGFVVLAMLVGGLSTAGAEIVDQKGPMTGLSVPRYVSLKSDRVNLREGPSKDHRTSWVFERAGLPVEITAEFDTWRKIRDSEGSEGWVLHSLLSGRRTALVAPWKKDQSMPLYDQPRPDSSVVANLQSGVIGNVKKCDGQWCRIYGDGFDGYEPQNNLWGVYPGEHVE